MLEKASIRYHKVEQCGLYRPKARKPEMGSFASIIDNVYKWSNTGGKLIQNTCTYEVSEDFDMDFLETYLVSMKHNVTTGDYFLAMWNKTHDSGDSVYALDPATAVDHLSKGALHKGNLPAKSIPGYATYFWIIPAQNTIATITFGTPRTGMRSFSYWLENFIATESRYVAFDDDDNFMGYAVGENDPNPELEPRFVRKLHKNPGKRDLILKNRDKIKGVIRRITLDRAQSIHAGTIDKLLSLVGITDPNFLVNHKIPLSYELNYTPTADELDHMIEEYENSHSVGSWEDIGFKFPQNNSFGADEKEWLSRSYAKWQIGIDVEWVVIGQLLSIDNLMKSVNGSRTELMELLPILKSADKITKAA